MDASTKTNDPHDTRLKELFGNREAFISFLKDCIKADWINDLDEDSVKRSPKSFILPDFRRKEADVVYEGALRKSNRKIIFYVLLENQSRVDYRMPYRLLLYIVEILRDFYNHSDTNARKRRDFKFPAVFPVVFYTGSGSWNVPLDLKEMFDGYDDFGDYLLNFSYALVDAKGYDHESVQNFRSKLLKVMMLFEKSRDFAGIIETAKKYKDDVRNLNDEERRILGVALDILSKIHKSGENYNLKEILYARSAEEVDSMLSDVIANAKNYEKNIIKKAKKERDIELIEKMLRRGDAINEIADFLEITVKDVENAKRELRL
jgi:hypothetical protein